jgi:hypothetical protein
MPFSVANAQKIGVIQGADGNYANNMNNIVTDVGGGASWEVIPVATFNAMTGPELCDQYDVLYFGWVLSGAVNASWAGVIKPYLDAGCGVVYEDPANTGDLTGSGVTLGNFDGSGDITITPLAGLTDGVVSGQFSNHHFGFASFSSDWTAYMSRQSGSFAPYDLAVAGGPSVSGANGRMVYSGQDPLFHGFKGGSGSGQNQYQMALNSVCWALGREAGSCELLPVDIDVKPGSFPNSVNLCSGGAVPLAILGSDTFDVTEVDTSTLVFAGSGIKVVGKKDPNILCSYEDVSGDFSFTPEGAPDGYTDLVCHFVTTDISALDGESLEATLEGTLLSGQPISGSDSINIVKDTCE